MDEIRKLTLELLHEMEGITAEAIEDLRTDWIACLKEKDLEKAIRLESFVNAVCDTAMEVLVC